MIREPALQLRPYSRRDHARVERLLKRSSRIHTHLDWEEPKYWLRRSPAVLAFRGRALIGLLAAAPDPPDVAWVRLAVLADGLGTADKNLVLDELWGVVQAELSQLQVARVAALTFDAWIEPVLANWGFAHSHQVMVLSRSFYERPQMPVSPATIRPARDIDLHAIVRTDNAAFDPPWALSERTLHGALVKASYASVAELNGTIVGYQITTGGRDTAHLARLAVLPALQGQRIGRALVADQIGYYEQMGTSAVGVNTQDNNTASLALYAALGFEHTGESYPVWQLHLNLGS